MYNVIVFIHFQKIKKKTNNLDLMLYPNPSKELFKIYTNYAI